MRFLIDEMLPPAAGAKLRELGHDAIHVSEVGLIATPDALVAALARAQQRCLVTENVVDFAHEEGVVLVFVLMRKLPSGARMAPALAGLLDEWASANPEPYVGSHWPARR